jgi:hypothetical protein
MATRVAGTARLWTALEGQNGVDEARSDNREIAIERREPRVKAKLCGLVSWRSGSEGFLSPFLLPGHFGFHALARGILFSLRLRGRSAVHWFDRGSVLLAKDVL